MYSAKSYDVKNCNEKEQEKKDIDKSTNLVNTKLLNL